MFDAASRDKPGAANRAVEILRAMMFRAEEWGLANGTPTPASASRRTPARARARCPRGGMARGRRGDPAAGAHRMPP